MFILYLASWVNRVYECQIIEMDEGTVPMRSKISMIGIPTDHHGSFLRGPAKAPAAIRAALGSEPGGLTARQVMNILLALDAPIIVTDVGELNPDRGIHGMTAVLAAKLVKELAAAMTANPLQ